MVKIYHRKTQQVIEQAGYQDELLQKLYDRSWGKFLLPWITFPLFSSLATIWDYSPFSKKKIADFVQTYQIELRQFERDDYNSFAQFFTRKFKEDRRPLFEMNQVLAVADAKLQIFSVHQERTVTIKGQDYTLADLLQDANLAKEFEGGTLCLYRLGIKTIIATSLAKPATFYIRKILPVNFILSVSSLRRFILFSRKTSVA